MDCRRFHETFVAAELGLVPEDENRALWEHVERCPACAAEAKVERSVTGGLLRLRVEIPFRVDVADRVAAGIEAMAPLALGLPPRVRRLALATAAVLVLGMSGLLAWLVPAFASSLWAAGTAAVDGFRALTALVEPAVPVVAGFARTAWTLVRAGVEVLGATGRLAPAAGGPAAATMLAFAALTSFVLARDLRGRRAPSSLKES
jgi:hypothetical protein